MKPREQFGSRKIGATLSAGLLALVGVWISFFSSGSSFGQTAALGGMISGTVTADHGVVRAFRVKAKDTGRRITYTVFTNKGRYQVFNLPTGSYEVSALQEGYESPIQRVQLQAGGSATADLALRTKAPATPNLEPVDFDAYLPPGRGRDIYMNRCSGCHGLRLSNMMTRANPAALYRSEEAWRNAVHRMFDQGYGGEQLLPKLPTGLPAADRETLIQYLAANFGEDSRRRDLKVDQPVLDEDELAEAIYVQYELPPGRSGGGTNWPSRVSSTIWFSGGTAEQPAIMAMDLNNLEYPGRFREWPIPQPASGGSYRRPQHGLMEVDGRIYWVELRGTAVGELDPKTGEMNRYPSPSGAGLHTIWADSKGRVWGTSIFGPSLVVMFDTKTKQLKEWDPAPGLKAGGWYGVVADQQDRVWVAGTGDGVLANFDPKTEKWTTTTPPKFRLDGSAGAESGAPRRPAFDSKGKIWYTMTGANAIGMYDPDTGKTKAYTIPFRYSNPYGIRADGEDNIWSDLGWGQSEYTGLGRFDQKTEKFTFFPYPELGDHNAQLQVDAQGTTLWFGTGRPGQLTSFKPKGNVPLLRSGR